MSCFEFARYEDHKGHSDFVRGASWDPDPEGRVLLTCGWDGRVLQHDVPRLPHKGLYACAHLSKWTPEMGSP